MADKIPVKAIYTLADVTSLGEFNPGDTIPVANGGTGAVDATEARTNLGLASMAIQESDDVEITGGTIDGTVIGGTTPAAVNATTLSASGDFTTYNSGAVKLGSGDNTCFYALQNAGGSGGAILSIVQVGVAERGRFDASGLCSLYNGLAVTGALSATGALTTNGLKEDTAGNLGLGVTPSAWSGFKSIELGSGNSLSGGSAAQLLVSANAYYNTGWKYAANAAASQYNQSSGVHTWYSAPSGTAGNPITFTQAMTLDAKGNLLLNDTNISVSDSNSIVLRSNLGQTYWKHATGAGSGTYYAAYSYGGSVIGSVTQSGTTGVVYNTTSDHRLKENVRHANATRFNDIEFVDFEWIDGRHDCGVIAHQLQSVYPDLVIGEKDAVEIRAVEIEPAIPAVTEQVLVTEAVYDDDGEEIEPAVYETVEITPAVEAVTEDQEFPIYQQVNYQGLIGRMGTRIQIQDKQLTAQAELIAKMEARLALLEAA